MTPSSTQTSKPNTDDVRIKEIKELQRLLGKKTLEVEILKEAVEWGRSKNLIARSPLLPGDTQ